MSYIAFKHNSDDKTLVLDTKDLVAEILDKKKLSIVKEQGIPLVKFSKASFPLGLDTSKSSNEYKLFLHGYDGVLYSGSFPTRNNRNDLFCHEISILDYNVLGNKIVVVVGCNVWCKYDIEFPMVMSQVISFSIKNVIGSATLSAFTSKPVLLTDESEHNRQKDFCQGDYPTECINRDTSDMSLKGGLKVLGVDFGKTMPIYEDLNNHLKYFK